MTTVKHTTAYDNAATYALNHARIGYQSHAADLSPSAASATSSADGFPADAPLRPDTGERWKPDASNSTLTIDLGSAQTVDYVGVMGYMSGVTVTVQSSPDNSTWTTFSESAAMTEDGPVLFLDASRSARYWRIQLDGVAQIASVYIGEVLEMQRPFFGGNTPIPLARQTQLRSAMSRGGQFLGQDIVRTGYSGSMQWTNLKPAWYRSNVEPLVKHLRTRPAFVAWNIRDYPQDLIYAWSRDDIAPEQRAKTTTGLYDVTINWTGVGNSE